MLLGCCHCGQEESQPSAPPTYSQPSTWSESFPSTSTFPNSTDYSGAYGSPCPACLGDVMADAYSVDLGPMTEHSGGIYNPSSDCMSMLNATPFRVNPHFWFTPLIYDFTCQFGNAPRYPGTSGFLGCLGRNDDGSLYCAPEPLVSMAFIQSSPPNVPPYWSMIVQFQFQSPCAPSTEPQPLQNSLYVRYAIRGQEFRFKCLNEITLPWETAGGNQIRQDPDNPTLFEQGGYAPGNNNSWERHRGTFPEFITIRPWGT
jgi:hypothetical protein